MNQNQKRILGLLDSGQYQTYLESDFSDLRSLKNMGIINLVSGEFASNPILYVSLTTLGHRIARQLRNS